MSLYGFQLVLRVKGLQHPNVIEFFIPKKNFKDEETMLAWVSTINGRSKKYQQKQRRKQKKRPNFWNTGQYSSCRNGAITKGLNKPENVAPKHWQEEGHPPRKLPDNLLSAIPTLEQILSFEPRQVAH